MERMIDLTYRCHKRFDTEKMMHEIQLIESGAVQAKWLEHYDPYLSRAWKAIPLVSCDGRMDKPEDQRAKDDYTQFCYTPIVEHLPYFKSVLEFFQCQRGRARILKLLPGAEIGEHRDINEEVASFAHGQVRLHIPIATNPEVSFYVGGARYHMREGHLYYVDFTERHSVRNGGDTERIHLVLDLKVNDWLARMFPPLTLADRIVHPIRRTVEPMFWKMLSLKQKAGDTFWKHYEGSSLQAWKHRLTDKGEIR